MRAASGWLQRILKRLPMVQPGGLVVSSEGVGTFLGDLAGNNRVYGVKRGDRTILERYPDLDDEA